MVLRSVWSLWTQLHQTWRGHRAIIPTQKVFLLRSDILLHFQTRATQSRLMYETTPNFALFDPSVKIRGHAGEISIPIIEALPTTKILERHLMAIHCVAAEHGGLTKST